jgi:hypothetical protein
LLPTHGLDRALAGEGVTYGLCFLSGVLVFRRNGRVSVFSRTVGDEPVAKFADQEVQLISLLRAFYEKRAAFIERKEALVKFREVVADAERESQEALKAYNAAVAGMMP